MPDDVELAIVTMVFDTPDSEPAVAEQLFSVLTKYVVLSRSQPGCRNIDLCSSVTRAGRLVILEKWESAEAQRAHFDSPEMVEMAKACEGLLTQRPEIDLLEGISAHDLA
jgi:quinol monooxygenase YgiN